MSRFVKTVLLALVIVGGTWALLNRDQLKHPADMISLLGEKLSAIPVSQPVKQVRPLLPPAAESEPVIRIASFKLTGHETTINKTSRLPMLLDICRRYDAIALQGIDGRDDAWLQLLTDSLNSSNSSADYYFINDRINSDRGSMQSAILFNRKKLELDQSNWYTVNDPDDLLRREPLVGWFRTRVPNQDEAFTFTLVNIELTPVRPDQELAYLAELFRAVRNDGRGEDDVIIAGDFNSGDRGLEPIHQQAGLTWVVSNTPTDIRNRTQYDNLVFGESATIEFTGQGGVFDFLRKYNLRLDDAAVLSERMPVWAEFSAIEGGVKRRVANEILNSDRR